MTAAPAQDGSRRPGRLVGEAAGIAPVLALAAVALWLALSHDPRTPEAGPPPSVRMPQPETVVAQPALQPPRLIIVAVSESRAGEVRELLRVEAQLRGLLGETPRDAEVITAISVEQARAIAESVRQDQANPASSAAFAAVIVP